LILLLFTDDGLLSAAVGRVFELGADAGHARRGGVEIDDAGVGFVVELGPRRGRAVVLADGVVETGAGEFDGLETARAESLRSTGNGGFGVGRGVFGGGDDDAGQESDGKGKSENRFPAS
jgi:hypothetical protein